MLCVYKGVYIYQMKLETKIFVRVTSKEKKFLFKKAKQKGIKPSELIRNLINSLNQN